jgi:hypothetical protein
MTGTPDQSAALGRIIVKAILTIAEIVRTLFHQLSAGWRKAGPRLLAPQPRLFWPKRDIMGRHVRSLRHRTGFLPPSASALHAAIAAAPAEDHRQPLCRFRRLLVRADTRIRASHLRQWLLDWSPGRTARRCQW